MKTSLKTAAGVALVLVWSPGLVMAASGGSHNGGGGHSGGSHSGSAHAGGGHSGGGSHSGGSHASGASHSNGGSHASGGSHGGASFYGSNHAGAASNHGGGRGGSYSGGANRSAAAHTASFSAARPSGNALYSANAHAIRPSWSTNSAATHAAISPGARPGIASTFYGGNPQYSGNRSGSSVRTSTGIRPSSTYRTGGNLASNYNYNRTNNLVRYNGTASLVRTTNVNWSRGGWYHGNWYGNSYGNGNYGWYRRPWGWWTAGGWGGPYTCVVPWCWGYWPYYNPYYTGTVEYGTNFIDYSQPIVAVQPIAPEGPTGEDQARVLFDAARNAFASGDYPVALAQVEQAIALRPNEPVLHEFRGLALFSLGRYQEAAAADYAVLSTGPGWDWTTLSSLYPNIDVYTQQLRGLEQFVRSNPAVPEARFLLAYHYLTCRHTDAATAQLRVVVGLNPRDRLSAQLLDSLSPTSAAAIGTPQADPALSPPPSEAATVAGPVDASSLAGDWTAARPDSGTITLTLANDGHFTWVLHSDGGPRQFSGTYTLADNLLVLKQGNKPVMAGQVLLLGDDRFNFKLAGDNPSDPGLTFVR